PTRRSATSAGARSPAGRGTHARLWWQPHDPGRTGWSLDGRTQDSDARGRAPHPRRPAVGRAAGPCRPAPRTREAERRIQAGEMSVVRLAFADQHGVLRGKTFAASEIDAALKNGVGFSA